MLLTLVLGTALAAVVATAGTAQQAEAAIPNKLVFTSNRATGTGVDNPTGDYEIFSMNPDGSGIKQLTSNSVNDYEPILSADGAKVAYQSEGIQSSNSEGDTEIYVMNVDGRSQRRLTRNAAHDDHAAWSPDGRRIAFVSMRAGNAEIYVMNADGTGQTRLTRDPRNPGTRPAAVRGGAC